MLVNAINVQPIRGGSQFKSINCNPNFKGTTVYTDQEDTFAAWATKNVATAAAFSVIWDAGTNILSKFSRNIDSVPVGKMASNIARVSGVFLLIGGIFKVIPLTGITLPFISAGGSSMLTMFFALGLLQKVSEEG